METPDLKAIKGIKPFIGKQDVQMYEIPFTQELPLADGSGKVSVVVKTVSVTKAQLQQSINQATQQIAQAQKALDEAKAKLDAINAMEAKG